MTKEEAIERLSKNIDFLAENMKEKDAKKSGENYLIFVNDLYKLINEIYENKK